MVLDAELDGQMLKQRRFSVTSISTENDQPNASFLKCYKKCFFQRRFDVRCKCEWTVQTPCFDVAMR